MTKEKLLSVIVPVYKVEPYLRRCIDSIRCQTYRNLQIILVDDGSPDNCGAICNEYTKIDSRIITIHQKNEGLSGARNNGLLFAKGDYIAFVDSDDWIHPTMYQTLIDMIEEHNLGIARCSVIETDGKSEKRILPPEKNTNQLIQGKKVFELYFTEFLCKPAWNAVYRRKIVCNILSPAKCHSEDNYVSGRYLYRANRMMVTDKPLYYYWQNPHGIIRGGNRRMLDICVCTEKLRNDLIAEEHMNNLVYINRLNKKLARELYHFIRYNSSIYRVATIAKEQKQFIVHHLSFFRSIRFMYLLHKKHVSVI